MAINRVPNGFRQFTGQLINQIIDVVNGTANGVFNGTLGGTTPAAASVTTLTQNGAAVTVPELVAATGTSISTVRAITGKALVLMSTVATSAQGIRLPAWATGKRIHIQNVGTTSGSVYPATGGRIGAAATNARTTIAKRKGSIFVGSSVTRTWEVLAGA